VWALAQAAEMGTAHS